MPTFTAPYTHRGNVWTVPALKFVITKSSMERANASSAPARMPGKMIGKVTFQNVVHGPAPRSWAASSSDRSNPASRARTVTVT